MAARFWVAQPVSGAIVSVASPPQIRLTVSSTTGMTSGDVRIVSGIVGTTEANGTWTITVIDATHIDLQGTTFANLYTSGGIVVGAWDSTNTNNWVTSSGGTNYGQTVPGTSDAVTLDGSSGGSTVTVNGPNSGAVTVQSITCGAFTGGTLDFSANNNNVTLSAAAAFNGSGTGTRTINLGNGTWSITTTSNGTIWNLSTTTNLTFNANSSTIDLTGVTVAANNNQTIQSGGKTYSTIKISGAKVSGVLFAGAGGTIGVLTNTAACVIGLADVTTITTLTQSAKLTLILASGVTTTFTNAPTISGTASAPVGLLTNFAGDLTTPATVSCTSGTFSGTWCAIEGVTFSGGATFSFTSSLDLGKNSGATITAPSAGGGPVGQQCM